jgi:hypothetical protein
VNQEAPHFAERVRHEAGADQTRQAQRAFEIAFGRAPTESEREDVKKFLRTAGIVDPLTGLCRVLLNSNEFIYVD